MAGLNEQTTGAQPIQLNSIFHFFERTLRSQRSTQHMTSGLPPVLPASRKEVMQYLAQEMDQIVDTHLKPINDNWQTRRPAARQQPGQFFIGSTGTSGSLLGICRTITWRFLVGDIITEEALPTYSSWLMEVDGIEKASPQGWTRWVRMWTAEENRHGDLLNKYIYLSGRVNMRQMEISTQWLIADGMEIGTANDPYRNFVYTSFQERPPIFRIAARPPWPSNTATSNCRKFAASLRPTRPVMPRPTRVSSAAFFEVDPSEMMLALKT